MELKNIKKYEAMTAEEQCRWVSEFAEWVPKGRELAKLTTGWNKERMAEMEQGLRLLAAWTACEDYCVKTAHFGDYDRRAYRLPVYIENVTEALADGLTMTDERGNAVAVVLPGMPLRRRGRPTKEEQMARLQGEIVMPTDDSPETRKRRAIAKMLGLEVVNGENKREKNNAELKAEREARRKKEEAMNPSLFGSPTPDRPDKPSPDPSLNEGEKGRGVDCSEPKGNSLPSIQGGDGGRLPTPCAQLMSDSYEMRMAQDKLHLNQLAWLLSPELAKRTETVQSLRVTSESASERAKTMADMGAKPEDVEPYSQQAKEATEAYESIFADVDEELAVLHKRLYLDVPFVDGFKKRFKGVDIEKIQYITRPYYEKVKKKSPEIDVRIRTIIEQENPEYAAKMKAEQAKKEELQQLHRYIMRTDKPASDERVKTMTERIERVRQLAGDEVADSYLPVLEKTKEENVALNKAKAEKKRPTPDPSLKESGVDTPADGAADEKKPKKSAKKSTKQEKRKPTKQEGKEKPAAK